MSGGESLTSLTALHQCGHTQVHNVPTALAPTTLQRILSKLGEEPCSNCALENAWEQFGLGLAEEALGTPWNLAVEESTAKREAGQTES